MCIVHVYKRNGKVSGGSSRWAGGPRGITIKRLNIRSPLTRFCSLQIFFCPFFPLCVRPRAQIARQSFCACPVYSIMRIGTIIYIYMTYNRCIGIPRVTAMYNIQIYAHPLTRPRTHQVCARFGRQWVQSRGVGG